MKIDPKTPSFDEGEAETGVGEERGVLEGEVEGEGVNAG